MNAYKKTRFKEKKTTEADNARLKASVNYVVSATNRPKTHNELESLRLSVNNEGVKKKKMNMGTILDAIRNEGKREGEIKGEIKTIQTVATLRFQESSKRLTRLSTKLDNLKLLNKTCQFALTAPSLLDVENFVENLIPIKSKDRRVAKRRPT